MGIVIRFPRARRHARASFVSGAGRACKMPSASNVRPFTPRRSAKVVKPSQCSGGIDSRFRHELTIEGFFSPSAAVTAFVPPKASRMLSTVSNMMDVNIVRDLRTSQVFATSETTSRRECAEIPVMAKELDEIASRLVATREALDFDSQAEFAKEIGLTKTKYNPFETGKRRITIDAAKAIRSKFAIPLDWIYCGDPSRLPVEVYRKLRRRAA